ncbi:hypothetical protein FACS1894124_6640 [Spirochaetia bacterium]|nr:hypothetical protein FACS1894124_6640 [Spirochaetia bacterium]
MKKGIYAILAVLTISALAMMGCPTDGGDDTTGDTTYTVTFDKNGGTSEASPATASTTTSGGFVTLPATNPGSPAGKQFGGWNTKVDGTGTEFTASSPVTASITVYAKWVDFDPTPVLNYSFTDTSYEKDTTAQIGILRVVVTNAAEITADGGTLTYQWYKAADDTSAGTTVVGQNSQNFTPPVTELGETYYWVVVTNSKAAGQPVTSTRVKIIVYQPSGDSAIEKIVSNNAAVPLWEFTLPAGAFWADYEEFSIEYYVSKDSRIVGSEQQVRSRLYGAYLAADLTVPDQGNANGWGGFRMVNWNGSVARDGVTVTINPNNDFIIDNSKGSGATFGSHFTAEGGAASKWFTAKYSTDDTGGNAIPAKDLAKVTLLDSATVNAIYVGAGIIGPSGNSDDFEFYAKNPTLLHNSDPTLNIRGAINMTGTNERLFAGNLGSAKGGTDRAVVTEYEDKEGEIMISFDLAAGTGDFPSVTIMEGESLGSKFPTTEPTRDGFNFLGWFDGETEATAATTFDVKTTLTAKWELTGVVGTYNVNLTGQTTKNDAAWTSNLTDDEKNGLVFSVGDGFNANLYDTVEIIAKFHAADGTTVVTDIPASNFQAKFFASEVPNANNNGTANWWNFGAAADDCTVSVEADNSLKITKVIPVAVKTAGIWGISIAPSNGTAFAANFVEVFSIKFPVDRTYKVDLVGQTTKNTTAWTSNLTDDEKNGLVFSVGDGFNANLYDTVEIIAKFHAADGTTVVTDIPASNFQAKFFASEVPNANNNGTANWWNFGAVADDCTVSVEADNSLKITKVIPVAVKTAGIWGISIAPSNGTAFAAQFVEVLSIAFPLEL